ncbi:MAG TPA: YjbQ family protein [Thermoplasmatales archaeon]|nr:YjbQ family protein [Thermoplasmatales archaeon]
MFHKSVIELDTKGEMDIIDITHDVQEIVEESGIENGIVLIFCPGSTGAITTIEYEDGLLYDLPQALEKIAPKNAYYRHEEKWHDGNGHSHVRASIIGPSLTVPIENRRLILGTWQQIVFVECDVRARRRKIIVHIVG